MQRSALKTWAGDGEFLANLGADPEISTMLSAAELQDACGLDRHFRHVDKVFRDLGIPGRDERPLVSPKNLEMQACLQ